MPGVLPRLAQYELTLLDWMEANTGRRASTWRWPNKCWPAFQTEFGFVPCYVNSPPDGDGLFPSACEVDIYGALSEYIGTCVSGERGDAAGHQQHRARRICTSAPSRANTRTA